MHRRMCFLCFSILAHSIWFVVRVIILGLALASLQGALPLHQPTVTAPEICICYRSGAGRHLMVIWNTRDGRPECSRPILWIFDGLNEQEKYRTKHFIGLLDSRCVRSNGWQERMKYWKLCDNSTVREEELVHCEVAWGNEKVVSKGHILLDVCFNRKKRMLYSKIVSYQAVCVKMICIYTSRLSKSYQFDECLKDPWLIDGECCDVAIR